MSKLPKEHQFIDLLEPTKTVTDNEIKFDNPGSPSSVKHTYTMNRRTGKLVMNFKNKVGEARTHSNCSVKEKLF